MQSQDRHVHDLQGEIPFFQQDDEQADLRRRDLEQAEVRPGMVCKCFEQEKVRQKDARGQGRADAVGEKQFGEQIDQQDRLRDVVAVPSGTGADDGKALPAIMIIVCFV